MTDWKKIKWSPYGLHGYMETIWYLPVWMFGVLLISNDFNIPVEVEGSINFVKQFLFVLCTTMRQDIKAWLYFMLGMAVFLVFCCRYDIDSAKT